MLDQGGLWCSAWWRAWYNDYKDLVGDSDDSTRYLEVEHDAYVGL